MSIYDAYNQMKDIAEFMKTTSYGEPLQMATDALLEKIHREENECESCKVEVENDEDSAECEAFWGGIESIWGLIRRIASMDNNLMTDLFKASSLTEVVDKYEPMDVMDIMDEHTTRQLNITDNDRKILHAMHYDGYDAKKASEEFGATEEYAQKLLDDAMVRIYKALFE